MDEQQAPAAPCRPPGQRAPRREPTGLVDLGALLRGVAGLRRVLETDLVLAAAAAQAGALDVAVDVVEGDREELAQFAARALGPRDGALPEPAGP